MSNVERVPRQREETPVDDVRRVREELSAQFEGDIERLADHASEVARRYRAELGLKSSRPVDSGA